MSDDELGDIYRHDIRAQGVAFDTRPLNGKPPTARSMIFVTPDGERSMNTYLGACVELGPEDVEADKAAGAKVTYFEGYLWDPPRAKEAIRLTAGHAHAAGREVSMTLSDSFCVDRYRDEFLDLMRSGTVDIVFANESEMKSLYQTASFETALELIRKDCKLAAVTRSEKGSVIVSATETETGRGDRDREAGRHDRRRRSLRRRLPVRLHQRPQPARLRRSRLARRRPRHPADRPAPAQEFARGGAEGRAAVGPSSSRNVLRPPSGPALVGRKAPAVADRAAAHAEGDQESGDCRNQRRGAGQIAQA